MVGFRKISQIKGRVWISKLYVKFWWLDGWMDGWMEFMVGFIVIM